MQDCTDDKLQIAYEGPALQSGRMPMLALGGGLRGQALLVERIAFLLYRGSVKVEIEVDPSFEGGSLLVPVHILTDNIKSAEHLLAGEGFTALANLLALCGFLGITATSIWQMFKRLHGRRISKPEDLPRDLPFNIAIDLFIEIYNDNEVQAQLRRTVDPLHRLGIEQFQTRRNGVVIVSLTKGDLHAADEAEVESLIRDEEVSLAVEKAAWRRTLAWHFSDGETSFDAKIEDETFWMRVEQGEAFAMGDRLTVHLRTTACRMPNGSLKVERTIPAVIATEHVRRISQVDLFDRT